MATLYDSLTAWLDKAVAKTMKREHPFVISVSGTVGKSSAKQAIKALLASAKEEMGDCVRTSAKNYNNELGVPLTIFNLPAPGRSPFAWLHLLWRAWLTSIGVIHTGVKTFVLELGVDKPRDMETLLSMVDPDIAVITAVTPDDPTVAPSHTSNFDSIDALAEEESLPVQKMKQSGTVVLNADDRRVFAMRHTTHAHVLTFGETDDADVRLVRTTVTCESGAYGRVPVGLEVELCVYQRPVTLFLPGIFGRSIGYVMAAAASVAEALDLPIERIAELPGHFTPMPGRARIIPGVKFTTLFDDTYNASPAAVISAIQDLHALALDPSQRRIACIGEMRELGAQEEMLHRRIGQEVAKNGIDLFVACGTFCGAMADAARVAGMREEQIKTFDDVPEVRLFLEEWIKPGDVILAKGSEGKSDPRGCRMERVIKKLMADPTRAKDLLCRQDETWEKYRV